MIVCAVIGVFIGVFFVAAFIMALKAHWPWLKCVLGTIRAPALVVAFLVTAVIFLVPLGIKYFSTYMQWLGISCGAEISSKAENWDYLSAAAALLGACISLIPIFYLIWQINLQQNQNEAELFARACELSDSEMSFAKIWGGLVTLQELLERRNRNIDNTKISHYRSQAIVLIERIIEGCAKLDIECYKICLYILQQSIAGKYFSNPSFESEEIGNLSRIFRLFTKELTNKVRRESLERDKELIKIAKKLLGGASLYRKKGLNSVFYKERCIEFEYDFLKFRSSLVFPEKNDK